VQLDTALPWLALCLTRGIAARLSARLAMESGREVFGVPDNVTQAVSFAPNLLFKRGAKLATCAEDVIEEPPAPVRAALTKLEQPEAEQRNLLVEQSLAGGGQKIYALLSSNELQGRLTTSWRLPA
jgi:DNA processing protein